MHLRAQVTLSIKQIHELLPNVATARPVFIWAPPGVGKNSLVERFQQARRSVDTEEDNAR